MTAAELYEALQGVPAEALCGTIKYHAVGEAWYGNMGQLLDDHAAALQRDAMTEYLIRWSHTSLMIVGLEGESVFLRKGLKYETHAPTRLHALAAACKYVKEQEATPPPPPAQG